MFDKLWWHYMEPETCIEWWDNPNLDCCFNIFSYFCYDLRMFPCSWTEETKLGECRWKTNRLKDRTSDLANESSLLTCVLMVSVRARYQSLMTLSISDWISSSVPWRVFSWGEEKSAALKRFKRRLRCTVKLDSTSACVRYLDDVFLARLVLGSPLHRPPSQIDSELRLRLVAAKLLESRKRYEGPCLTQRWLTGTCCCFRRVSVFILMFILSLTFRCYQTMWDMNFWCRMRV